MTAPCSPRPLFGAATVEWRESVDPVHGHAGHVVTGLSIAVDGRAGKVLMLTSATAPEWGEMVPAVAERVMLKAGIRRVGQWTHPAYSRVSPAGADVVVTAVIRCTVEAD